jgi:hypothetical protein
VQPVAAEPSEAGSVDPDAALDVAPAPVVVPDAVVVVRPAAPSAGGDDAGITQVLSWQTNDGPGCAVTQPADRPPGPAPAPCPTAGPSCQAPSSQTQLAPGDPPWQAESAEVACPAALPLALAAGVLVPEPAAAVDEEDDEVDAGVEAPDAGAVEEAGGASRPAACGGLVTSAGCVTTVGGTGARAANS